MFTMGAGGTAAGGSPFFGSGFGDILSSLLGGIGSFFQGRTQAKGYEDLENQLRAAISQLGAGEQRGVGFLQPFQETGLSALQTALPSLQQLVTDPTAVRQKLLAGFGQDPGEEAAIQEGLRARQAAAAAGGTLGTSGEETAEQQFAQEQKQKDLANFLGQQTGLFQTGLGGLQTLGGQGLMAGKSIADLIAEITRAQAEAQAGIGAAQVGEAQSQAGGIGGLISDIASFL